MNPSPNLFIIGATGAGKTSIGRRLSMHYELPFVDLDEEIERHTGVDISTVFEIEGEAGFRVRESAVLDACTQRVGLILATGAGAVLAAGNRERLSARGFVVWLQINVEQQLERLQRDARRPLLAGVDRRARLRAMHDMRQPLYQDIADLAVPAAHGPVAAASERCIALLDRDWQRPAATVAQQRA